MTQAPPGDGPLAYLRLGWSLPASLALVAVAGVLVWRFVPMRAALLVTLVVAVVALRVGGRVVRVLARAHADEGSSFEAVLEREPRRAIERPRELVQVERLVAGATASATDAHLQLRPLLRAILVARLADPEAAEGPRRDVASALDDAALARRAGTLGAELWELVRPGRPRPTAWNEPGVDLATLRRIVEELEAHGEPR